MLQDLSYIGEVQSIGSLQTPKYTDNKSNKCSGYVFLKMHLSVDAGYLASHSGQIKLCNVYPTIGYVNVLPAVASNECKEESHYETLKYFCIQSGAFYMDSGTVIRNPHIELHKPVRIVPCPLWEFMWKKTWL